MAVQIAMIFVRQGKAYLSVMAQTEHGLFMGIEPAYTTALTVEDLLTTLEKVVAAGHPQIPHPSTREEWRRVKDPVLKAAGVKSRRAFFQRCVSYNIEWTEQAVIVYISQPDHLGRVVITSSTEKLSLAKDAPLRTIVEAILEDVRSRPELLAGSET